MNKSEIVATILKKNPYAFDPTRIHRPSEDIKRMIRREEENPQYNKTIDRYFVSLKKQAKQRDPVLKQFIKKYLSYFHNIGTLEKMKNRSQPYSTERKKIIKQIDYENNYLNKNKDKFDDIFHKEKITAQKYVKEFNEGGEFIYFNSPAVDISAE
jgi:hypothetical protein